MVGVGASPNAAACCDDTFQYNLAVCWGFVLSRKTKCEFHNRQNEIPETLSCEFADFEISQASQNHLRIDLKTKTNLIMKCDRVFVSFLDAILNEIRHNMNNNPMNIWMLI